MTIPESELSGEQSPSYAVQFDPTVHKEFSPEWTEFLEGQVFEFQNATHQQALAKGANNELFVAMGIKAAEAFDQIFRLTEPYIHNKVDVMTNHQLGDLVDDIVAQIYERIYKGLPNFNHASKFTTWEMTVAINTVRTFMRRYNRDKTYELKPELHDSSDDSHITSLDALSAATDRRMVAIIAAMRKLSPEMRETLLLYHVEGLPQDEIANILGISKGAVRKRVHDGLRRVCKMIGVEPPKVPAGRRS